MKLKFVFLTYFFEFFVMPATAKFFGFFSLKYLHFIHLRHVKSERKSLNCGERGTSLFKRYVLRQTIVSFISSVPDFTHLYEI